MYSDIMNPLTLRHAALCSQDDDASGAEDRDYEAEDAVATLEVLEAADESDPTYLLYPPLALRTPRQKRVQIILLGELVLNVQAAFNRHLDRLHSAKDDCMDKASTHVYPLFLSKQVHRQRAVIAFDGGGVQCQWEIQRYSILWVVCRKHPILRR